jgi:hypothetical protein
MIILFGGLELGIGTDQWQRVMMVMVTGTGNVAGIIRFSAWRSDLVHTIQIFFTVSSQTGYSQTTF